MSAAHTPTPWTLGGKATIRNAKSPLYVATLENNAERAANAAFIVRAVNAHDDLVAALRETLAVAQRNETGDFEILACRALAKAEAQS